MSASCFIVLQLRSTFLTCLSLVHDCAVMHGSLMVSVNSTVLYFSNNFLCIYFFRAETFHLVLKWVWPFPTVTVKIQGDRNHNFFTQSKRHMLRSNYFCKQKIRMEMNFCSLTECHSTDVANRVLF